MKTNRFISLLLCVIMIMSLFTGLAGSASADDVITHEVQSGEILLKICEKHGLNYYACKNTIMALNGFTSEAQLAKLTVGQKLKLPASDAVAQTGVSTTVTTTTTVGALTTAAATTTTAVATAVPSGSVAYYLAAYTVQSGDTLANICKKLGSDYYYYSPVILAINSLTNANYIRPGQVLLIPTNSAPGGAGYAVIAHKVQTGETTTAICNRYGVSYQAMRQLVNGLNRRDNMDKIYPSQTVYVPSAVTAVGATTISTTTTGTTTSGTTATTQGAGYNIVIPTSNYGFSYAVVGGKEYVTTAAPGVQVSIMNIAQGGYVASGITATRLDTFEKVPVGYYSFTMPNADVMVEVEYEKGLTIQKMKAQGGSFDLLVRGSISNAAFTGDTVTVLAYPNQYYSVSRVTYQKADYTVSAVDVKKDASGNYSFTMPSYPVRVTVTFAPTQYHSLAYSNVVGQGSVKFVIGDNYVTQAEQGQTVTMIFTPDKNWVFNTSDFENNLAAHITNKASLGSFKKIDDTHYSFIMGTQDIDVTGVQFINRNTYTIKASVWKNQASKTNGSVRFNVIDQATGKVTSNTTKAKFGDTVQVVFVPSKNYVADIDYSRNNSKGAGNALLAWGAANNTFTMPDSNVTVHARFIQDGSTHTYAKVSRTIIPKGGGRVEFDSGDGMLENFEVGKVVNVRIYPNPNYDVSVAKATSSETIYTVSLNGKLVGAAPVKSNFLFLGQDSADGAYLYSFVKGSGTDTIRVAFASDYQGVNATFTQITENGEPAVLGIKGFSVNGNLIQSDAQVVSGDTVGFTIDVKEGYTITSVRKYVLDDVTDPTNPAEIVGSTTIIPGGKNNSYSYTITKDDINAAYSIVTDTQPNPGKIVFEITARKLPSYDFTVKYTQPKINGVVPKQVADTTKEASYSIKATQASTNLGLPVDPAVYTAADVIGIRADLAETNDVMVSVWIPKDDVDVFVTDNNLHQNHYYTFDKLLLNGTEFSSVTTSGDGDGYIANFILPKDTPDHILTTEITYKFVKTVDFMAIPLETLTLGGEDWSKGNNPGILDNIFSYSFDYPVEIPDAGVALNAENATLTDVDVKVWLNDNYLDSSSWTNVKLMKGPNSLVVVLSPTATTEAGYAETRYDITINYGVLSSAITSFKVTDADGTKEVGMYSGELGGFSGDPSVTSGIVTSYEASTKGYPTKFELTTEADATAKWILNGIQVEDDSTAATTQDGDPSGWTETMVPGKNTLEVIVTEEDKAPTKYTFIINCINPEKSLLTELKFETVNGYENILVPDLFDYAITVKENPVKYSVASASTESIDVWLNGVLVKSDTSNLSDEDLTLDNTVDKSVNTVEIIIKEADKDPTTYTVAIKTSLPAVKPLPDYLNIDAPENMVKFNKDLKATYKTDKGTAELYITMPDADTWVKSFTVNGVELLDDSGAPTYKAVVGPGSKVDSWKKGNNTVKLVMEGIDQKQTTYTLTVKYRVGSIDLSALSVDGMSLPLSKTQSIKMSAWLDAGIDLYDFQIDATAEDADATVTIRINGQESTQVTGTETASFANATIIDPSIVNYIDIVVEEEGFTTSVYHIDLKP